MSVSSGVTFSLNRSFLTTEYKQRKIAEIHELTLVNDQLDALFFNVFISTSLHVSSSKCSSFGGPTCINTPSGITHSSG